MYAKSLWFDFIISIYVPYIIWTLTQLTQRRCDKVVTTSLLTLSERCDTVENVSCADVGFRRCDNVALRRYPEVATT